MSRRCRFDVLLGLFTVTFAVSTFARAGEFDVTKDVTYVTRGDTEIKADLYIPKDAGPFPGVLVVHGGSWRGGNKGQLAAYAEKLAGAGYTAMAINYRLAPANVFPAQIEDCKSAVRFMRKNAAKYKIDPDRLGAVGYSAGGHLVALLGVTDQSCGLEGPDSDGTSTRLQCIVAGGAPCDFRAMPENGSGLAYWLGGTRADKPQAYVQASPANFVSKDDPPILFFHGDADTLVRISSPKMMIEKLTEVGVPTKLHTIAGGDHIGAARDPSSPEETVKFFDEHLKKGAKQSAAQ